MWRASRRGYVPQKSIDIPSSNGLSYSTGRTIIVEVPETVGFMSPADSYVKFDLTLSEATAAVGAGCSYLKCRPDAGVSALFESVRVYSRRTGELLDSIDEYGSYVAQRMHYSMNEPQKAKRGMTEGIEDPQVIVGSAYFQNDAVAAADGQVRGTAAAPNNPNFTRTTFCMPLRVGMFSSMQAVPVAALGGLRIEIDTVRQAEKALCRLPGHSFSGDPNCAEYAGGKATNNSTLTPLVNIPFDKMHKIYGVGLDGLSATADDFVGAVSVDIDAVGGAAGAGVGADMCSSVISQSEQNQSPALAPQGAPIGDGTISCPFRVGEALAFVAVDRATGQVSPLVVSTVAGGVKCESIEPLSAADGGGTRVSFDVPLTFAAAAITYGTAGGADSQTVGSLQAANGSGVSIYLCVPNNVVGSQVTDFNVGEGGAGAAIITSVTAAGAAAAAIAFNTITPSFTIANVSMVAQEIDAPELNAKAMQNGMNYSFKAIQNYKISIPEGFTSTSDILPIANSKCYSVLVVPTSQATYDDAALDRYDVIHGRMDGMQRFQFQVDGRLQPDRKVECSNVLFNQVMNSQYSYELIKALGAADIPFRNIKDTADSFVIPLQLGQDRFSFDAVGKDFILNTEFGTRTKPLLVKVYVCHERSLMISQAGVTVSR